MLAHGYDRKRSKIGRIYLGLGLIAPPAILLYLLEKRDLGFSRESDPHGTCIKPDHKSNIRDGGMEGL